MTLDLTKPMRWLGDGQPLSVIYHDARGALLEHPGGVRHWSDLDILERTAENIPPEPVESDLVEQLMGAPTEGLWGWEAVRLGQLLGLAADEITRLNADLATTEEAADRLATVIRELLERTSGNPIRRNHPVWVEAYAVLADYEAQKSALTKAKGGQQS